MILGVLDMIKSIELTIYEISLKKSNIYQIFKNNAYNLRNYNN